MKNGTTMAKTHAGVTLHNPTMNTPNDNDPITLGDAMKYAGTIFLGLLVAAAAWLGKLIGSFVRKQFEAYVNRIESAVGKVEDISSKLTALMNADVEINKRLDEVEKSLEALHKDVERIKRSIDNE